MNYKHGEGRKGKTTRLFNIWRGIKKRCNPSVNHFATKDYAARGISICEEWQSYIAFRDWSLANGYADNLSIDRIDNDGGYSPNNCRWADRKMQARNRRSSHFLEIDGERRTLAEWSERTGIRSSVFCARLQRGWTARDAVLTPTVQREGAY
jgi:hypothetical protein